MPAMPAPARTLRSIALLVMLALALPGCKDKDSHTHDDGHKHDDGHGHKDDAGHAGHNHHHTAPHGGALVEIGDHVAHLEFKLDPAAGTLTMWVLDGEAAKPVRTKQSTVGLSLRMLDKDGADTGGEPVKLTLEHQADELTGDKVGDSAVYSGSAEALKGAAQFEITLDAIEVRGHKADRLSVTYPHGGE